MERFYSKNALLHLLYNELDALDRLEIEHLLEMDSTLLEEYNSLVASKLDLPRVTFSPREDTISAILNYA